MQKYFNKGAPEGFTLEFPVTAENFPPSEGSKLASPAIGKKYDTKQPLYPTDAGYEKEISTVAQIRQLVERDVWPTDLLTELGSRTNGRPTEFLKTYIADPKTSRWWPKKASSIVHMDDPYEFGLELTKYWRRKNMGLKFKDESLNEHVKFVEGMQAFTLDLNKALVDTLYKAFEVKYYWGVARPEECLGFGPTFTHYQEGSPTHPECPSGHSSVAGATVEKIIEWFVLDDEQYEELIDSAFDWGAFRIFSGVHSKQGHDMGLGLNSPTMRKEFPDVAKHFE